MNGSTVQQIVTALAPLSKKIEQGGAVVWKAEYRQVFIDAWVTIIFWAIVLVAVIVLAKYGSRALKKADTRAQKSNNYYDGGFAVGMWATRVISVVVSLTIFGIIVTGGIEPLLNPVQQTIWNITSQAQGN